MHAGAQSARRSLGAADSPSSEAPVLLAGLLKILTM